MPMPKVFVVVGFLSPFQSAAVICTTTYSMTKECVTYSLLNDHLAGLLLNLALLRRSVFRLVGRHAVDTTEVPRRIKREGTVATA